jgi:predicted DNA-binding transcriptional regulator AlpA
MPNTALIQMAAVCAITGKNNLMITEMVNADQFPAPHAVNNGIPVWLVGDVKGWLSTQPVEEL